MSAFTTSPSYRETLRRHRLLLSVPVLLGGLIAAWFVIGAPKSYLSTASLWVDNSAPNVSSVGNVDPGLTPPSTVEQGVLNELLTTRSFALSVADHSTLGSYLATHHSSGFSPSALVGGGGGPLPLRILGALSLKKVTSTMPGPQVLQISYAGPTAAVAQSTLAAIVTELGQASNRFGGSYARNIVAYYKAQVATATQALYAAEDAFHVYQRRNPSASPSDPNITALTAGVANARAQLTTATQSLDAAASAGAVHAEGFSLAVVDPASAPVGPTSGKKKYLEGILGGLLAGLLISFLGVVALTRGKPDPWEDELAVATTTNGRVKAAANGKPAPARKRTRTAPTTDDALVDQPTPTVVKVP